MRRNHVNPDVMEQEYLSVRIAKILAYTGGAISSDILNWLKTDAIYYPELIENTLQDIDETRFIKGRLSKQECWDLFDNLVQTHESFTLIDSLVDDYLISR
jgi:hypothetical protein